MATCIEITDEGFLVATETPLSNCTTSVLITTAEYNETQAQVDFEGAAMAFTFSFGLVLTCYYVSYVVGSLKRQTIKSLR